MNTKKIIITSLVILIIILFIFYIIFQCITTQELKEHFIGKEQSTALSKKWKKRLKELKSVSPLLYRKYFNPIELHGGEAASVGGRERPNKIFVSIASYRDDQCSDTLRNVIENADHPEHLHIFICQQNAITDEDCKVICSPLRGEPGITQPRSGDLRSPCDRSKVKIERLHYNEARGPVWARYRIQQHYGGEEYFLQIDSHTRLIKSWDTILKNQLDLCPNPDKAVLTQYPLEFDNVPKKDRGDPIKENWRIGKMRSGLYIDKFGPEGFTRIQSDYTDEIERSPYPGVGWAAGFSFSKGKFITDVPVDPYLYLFFGEQMDIIIRGYCAGYDFYSPTLTIAYHIYTRDHRPTFWQLTHQSSLEILARFRLYVKFGYLSKEQVPERYRFVLVDLDKYSPSGGEAAERTVEEYEKEAGIRLLTEEKLS